MGKNCFQKNTKQKFKHFLMTFFKDFEKFYFVKFYMIFTCFKGGYFGNKLGFENGQKLQKKAFSCTLESRKNRQKVVGPVWIRDPRASPGGSFFGF